MLALFERVHEHVLGPDAEAGVLVRRQVRGKRHAPGAAPRGQVTVDVYHIGAALGIGLNGGGTPSLSGWPDSMRSMSASGPFGPIFFGVWQSWQPPPMINILPRSTCDIAGAAAGTAPAPGACATCVWSPPQPESATATASRSTTGQRDTEHKRMGLNSSSNEPGWPEGQPLLRDRERLLERRKIYTMG